MKTGQTLNVVATGTGKSIFWSAPELLKREMQMYRQCEVDVLSYGYERGTKEFNDAMKIAIDFYRKFGMEFCVK